MVHFSKVFTAFLVLTFILICPIPETGATEDTITIAFVGSFSGGLQDYTNFAYNAAMQAVDEFNENGGVLGRKVVMLKLDGGNDPKRHYDIVNELGTREDVVAIITAGTSTVLLEATKAAKLQRIPYLLAVGNSQKLVVEYGHDYIFLFQPNTYMESKAISVVASLMPWRKFAWLGPDYVWGHDIFQYFEEHFKEVSAPVEWAAEAWHPLGAGDFKPYIKRIIDAKPDAVIIASFGRDMAKIIEQGIPYGMFKKLAIISMYMPKIPNTQIIEGVWNIEKAPFNYLAEKYPQTEKFVEKYQERYHRFPHAFSICGYDTLLAWKEAVIKAKTPDREAVAEALKGLSFESLRGVSTIRAIDGQMNCSMYCGRTVNDPAYQVAVMESIIEIPAEKTWLTESAILEARKNAESK